MEQVEPSCPVGGHVNGAAAMGTCQEVLGASEIQLVSPQTPATAPRWPESGSQACPCRPAASRVTCNRPWGEDASLVSAGGPSDGLDGERSPGTCHSPDEPRDGQGRVESPPGNPMRDSIPGPRGSRPEPKADTQPLSRPSAPSKPLLDVFKRGGPDGLRPIKLGKNREG